MSIHVSIFLVFFTFSTLANCITAKRLCMFPYVHVQMCAPVFCVFYSVCVYRCVGLFFVCSVLCSCADVCVFVHSRRGQNRILVSSSITLPYCLETEFLMEQGAHGVWLGWLPRQLSETTHLLVLPTSPHVGVTSRARLDMGWILHSWSCNLSQLT